MAAQSIVKLSLESNQYEQNIRKAQKSFENFTASIGINVKKLTAAGIAISAATAAFDKLSSAIGEAITKSLEMAKQAEGIERAFKRLDRPDLLDNLREATHNTINDLELMKQSVKFDNFGLNLDQMGTFLAFAQQQAKDTGQSIDYLVDSIVTGLGRKSLPILDNLGLSATDIRERMKETGDMTTAVAQIIQERMDAAGGYIETAADRAARADADLNNAMMELGKTLAPLEETGTSVFQSIELAAIQALNEGIKPIIPIVTEIRDLISDIGVTAETVKSSAGEVFDVMMTAAANAFGPIAKIAQLMAIIRGGGDSGDMGAGVGNIIDSIAANGGTLPDIVITGHRKTTGGGKKGATVKPFTWDSFDRQNFSTNEYLSDNRANILAERQMPSVWAMMSAEGMKAMLGNNAKQWDYGKVLDEYVADPDAEKRKGGTSEFKKFTEKMGELGGGLSQLSGGLKQIGIDVPESVDKVIGVIQGLTSILQGVQTVISIFSTSEMAANTIALAANTAALYAVAATNWIPFSGGGVVHAAGGVVAGNTYSNDMIPAALNAGEVVLNRAQVGNLASQIQGGGMSGMNLSATVTGEQIRLVLNNNGRRTGRGEYLQTNFR